MVDDDLLADMHGAHPLLVDEDFDLQTLEVANVLHDDLLQ